MTDQILTVALDQNSAAFTVLRVAGELDHHSAPALSEALEAVPFGPEHGVVIDLTGLSYCDSTGISVLVIAFQNAQAADSPFGLAGLNRELMRVFQIAGLDKFLPFHATVDEAVEAQRS
ncbi:STAS domain-containing protein [Umezawaea sp. Da 62-37]|uniref:STAS domain-containing protein n=1 Tax=Umezawaea sp. Da 62-37 TaxID=3075927 RepID=UPI0028F72781|nr:STAS domain-containing protein [Umezawaea sp. Da 62-37]WNV86190.1 STAS domain-containing protein [Umezawaea sp. Da 62-37]